MSSSNYPFLQTPVVGEDEEEVDGVEPDVIDDAHLLTVPAFQLPSSQPQQAHAQFPPPPSALSSSSTPPPAHTQGVTLSPGHPSWQESLALELVLGEPTGGKALDLSYSSFSSPGDPSSRPDLLNLVMPPSPSPSKHILEGPSTSAVKELSGVSVSSKGVQTSSAPAEDKAYPVYLKPRTTPSSSSMSTPSPSCSCSCHLRKEVCRHCLFIFANSGFCPLTLCTQVLD